MTKRTHRTITTDGHGPIVVRQVVEPATFQGVPNKHGHATQHWIRFSCAAATALLWGVALLLYARHQEGEAFWVAMLGIFFIWVFQQLQPNVRRGRRSRRRFWTGRDTANALAMGMTGQRRYSRLLGGRQLPTAGLRGVRGRGRW